MSESAVIANVRVDIVQANVAEAPTAGAALHDPVAFVIVTRPRAAYQADVIGAAQTDAGKAQVVRAQSVAEQLPVGRQQLAQCVDNVTAFLAIC